MNQQFPVDNVSGPYAVFLPKWVVRLISFITIISCKILQNISFLDVLIPGIRFPLQE